MTAAETQGKVTGRWTDEEHRRFKQGKHSFIFHPAQSIFKTVRGIVDMITISALPIQE